MTTVTDSGLLYIIQHRIPLLRSNIANYTQTQFPMVVPSETVFESKFWVLSVYISDSYFIHSMESLRRTELSKASTVSTCNSFAFHDQFLVYCVTYKQNYRNGICEPKSHPKSILIPMFTNHIKSRSTSKQWISHLRPFCHP